MKRLLTDAKPGDHFVRGDGRECVLISNTEKGKYKYRFRLKEDNDKREAMLIRMKEHGKTSESFKILYELALNDNHISWCRGKEGLISNDYEDGDWEVKASGIAAENKFWHPDLNIIKKI